ncbi:MAG: heme-binding domain-containing protein [Bacteroidales bacterium]|nr:heme-binding domain-containing protein [Bacteroidales bacterium]
MKKVLWILLVLLLILQVIPSNRPEVNSDNPSDLIVNNEIPDPIVHILKNACYDCHSNESHYPWYAYVAPVSYLVNRDIREGRSHLNFSDWEIQPVSKKLKFLSEISEEVLDKSMPMKIYPPLHPEARLTDAQRQALSDWTEEFGETLF